MLVSFSLSFTLSALRYYEFFTSTWDAGIIPQALTSASQGGGFYESPDFESMGVGSYLEVHPALILFAYVPLQWLNAGLIPYFVVQSAAVSLAAIPLFLLTRELTGSDRRALLLSGVFLFYVGVTLGLAYDIHLEALLPLEVFLVAWCWLRRRYGWGVAVALLSSITIEVGPILMFTVGLFYFLPSFRRDLPPVLRDLRARTRPLGSVLAFWARKFVRWTLASSKARASVALMATMVLAYLAIREVQGTLIPLWVGPAPAAPTHSALGGIEFSTNASALALSPSFIHLFFWSKIQYWVLMFALVGFLPLCSPRSLLLVAPWFGYTLASSYSVYTTLGNQYGLVLAGPMLLAAAYGLRQVQLGLGPLARLLGPSPPVPRPAPLQGLVPRQRLRRVRERTPWGLVLIVALGVNLLLSPADPVLQNPNAGGPAFHLSYEVPAGFANIQALAESIPTSATVLAGSELFPLLVDNPHAYSLLWYAKLPPYLPFNASHLPTYVFLSEDQFFATPCWLSPLLAVQNPYGLIGSAHQSRLGSVLLYELESPYAPYLGQAVLPPPGGNSTTVYPAQICTTAVQST